MLGREVDSIITLTDKYHGVIGDLKPFNGDMEVEVELIGDSNPDIEEA